VSIDRALYHGWQGELQSPGWGCLALVRVGLVQVFRRKLYWLVLALCFLQFAFFFMSIYAITQTKLPPRAQQQVLEHFGFSAQAEGRGESGYTKFIEQQSLMVMLLLAFSGSLLVGSDFRDKSLPFYLSRRIDRRHYIVGKLLAVSTIVAMLTTLPALLLFVEYGLFTGSADYWLEHWRVPFSVLVYGTVLCVVLSIMLVTLSACLQRLAPIAITWCSLFLLVGRLSTLLRRETGQQAWRLLDPWHNIHEVGKLGFGALATPSERQLALWSLAILVGVCSLCLVALVRRVRAIEIVQ
jgi:ABC-2 type transport system permease protein